MNIGDPEREENIESFLQSAALIRLTVQGG